jgi:hypothetical protein
MNTKTDFHIDRADVGIHRRLRHVEPLPWKGRG